jgi:hypothetical protein
MAFFMENAMSQPEESGLERDYCAGQLSLRDLAEIYGISEGTIRKRAKKTARYEVGRLVRKKVRRYGEAPATGTDISAMMGAVQNAGALAIARAVAENFQPCIYKLADMSTGWYSLQIADTSLSDNDVISVAAFIQSDDVSRIFG